MSKKNKISGNKTAQERQKAPSTASIRKSVGNGMSFDGALGEPVAPQSKDNLSPELIVPTITLSPDELKAVISEAVVSALTDPRVLRAFACATVDTTRIPGDFESICRRRIKEANMVSGIIEEAN